MYGISIIALVVMLLTSPFAMAELHVRRDVAYCDSNEQVQRLDVYSPEAGKNLPIIAWFHGGGWTKGNKASVQE